MLTTVWLAGEAVTEPGTGGCAPSRDESARECECEWDRVGSKLCGIGVVAARWATPGVLPGVTDEDMADEGESEDG